MTPIDPVISVAPVKESILGTSLEKIRPHPYPATTPMNVRILKIAVGSLGILKKRRE